MYDRLDTLSSLQCPYFARFFDIVDGQHSHGVYKGAGVMHKKMFKEIRLMMFRGDYVCKRVW